MFQVFADGLVGAVDVDALVDGGQPLPQGALGVALVAAYGLADLFAHFWARYVVPQPPCPGAALLDIAFHDYPLRLPVSAPINIGVGLRP